MDSLMAVAFISVVALTPAKAAPWFSGESATHHLSRLHYSRIRTTAIAPATSKTPIQGCLALWILTAHQTKRHAFLELDEISLRQRYIPMKFDSKSDSFAEVPILASLQRFQMNKRKGFFFALSVLLIIVAAITAVSLTAVGGGCGRGDGLGVGKVLQFSGSSSFRIALFADLHYGENAWDDWGPKQDIKSDRVLSNVLDNETPDFVIYLGDVITANNLPIPNASMYWVQAISPTRGRGIPWATLFGNHDDASFEWPLEWFSTAGIPEVHCPPDTSFAGEKDCSFRGTTRIELMKMERLKNPLSYSQSGPTELWPSVSNYILQISSSKDPESPSVFLYFLDSGGGSYPEVISYAQVNWFQEQSQAINPKSLVPELIFWHIPSQAYKKVAPNPKSSIKRPCVGSINNEEVASQEAEWGIMDALSNRSSVKAVFVGHNHGLDWCCPYKKLWLCFARHSGYGGYGTWPRGARILEMTEDPFSLNSWISMEDGTNHSYVRLCS